ncbi:MAG: hypothetical protein HEQ23_07665 [Tepidisphaera sp.]
MKNKRSLQERKRLSLERDRRNTYGESPHASRKNIKRRRATESRRYRRAANSGLDGASVESGENAKAAKLRKSGWKKAPDEPLGEVLAKKRARKPVSRTLRRRSPLR